MCKIKGAPGLLDGPALHGMGVDHGGPDIAVPQQFLDSANVIVGLK
jgi:hypothetical protein